MKDDFGQKPPSVTKPCQYGQINLIREELKSGNLGSNGGTAHIAAQNAKTVFVNLYQLFFNPRSGACPGLTKGKIHGHVNSIQF
ncbi:hypothetical protein EOK75_02335 [Pseudorhodobacter turbinis]|uniref:Uncharacterized protein n=1 Tax=Pseudorhodobacter turbinis TaxID=2500533 RepID=A0A4P8EDA6_9RHOB|nr:hypothetical protein [Pseudorhodobacter turbinis]QCO54729.1 hypothetical protein EOK75_02335 [Pseudorhodobacter turbinis]